MNIEDRENNCCHILEFCVKGADGNFYSIDRLIQMTEIEREELGITDDIINREKQKFYHHINEHQKYLWNIQRNGEFITQ